MTDRDLHALLDRAVDDLPEVDFAEVAWSGAHRERARRRRVLASGVGGVAAATAAVVALQLTGSSDPAPAPQYTVTTPPTTGALADHTRYAVMPLEGKEKTLRQFDLGLPSVVDPSARATPLSTVSGPPPSVVMVYLRPVGERYRPVLVTATGEQLLADRLTLTSTHDRDGNAGSPLGPRAVAEGRWVLFAQPGAVVRLDAHTGAVTRYPVPSQTVQHVGWSPGRGDIVARADDGAWTIDPDRRSGQVQRADDGAYDGLFRIGATSATRSLGVRRYGDGGRPSDQRSVGSPVTETWGETVGTQRWAATGAFYDQNLTSPLIRRGNGPIYQGLVAIDADAGPATVLVAPENPDGQTGRFKGCCTVLAWADDDTVVFQSVGSHGSWILAWDVSSGEVFQVTRIAVNPAQEAIPVVALNVGWRY